MPLLREDLSFAFYPDDSFEYLQLAHGLRHGCGFARFINGSCQPPEILRTPGYPLFLSAFGSNVRWALAFQAFLGGLVCLVVAMCVARYWSIAAAIAAELFVALDLPSIVMSNAVMSETLFQILVLLAVAVPLLVLSSQHHLTAGAIVAGILGGLAILSRPIGIILPIFLVIPFLAARSIGLRRRFIAGAFALLIPAIFASGWATRNYLMARYPGLSTVGAINMYYYRAANLVARRDGSMLAATRPTFGVLLGVPYERIYDASVQSAVLVQRMDELAFRIIELHPFQAAVMTLQAFMYLALSPMRSPVAAMIGTAGASAGDGLNAGAVSINRLRNTLRTMLRSPLLSMLVLLEVLLTTLLWLGVLKAIILCIRNSSNSIAEWATTYRLWVLYLLATGIMLLLLAAGGEADVRFRSPAIPLLAIVAAIGYFPRRPLLFIEQQC